jgi:DNA-binding winged helix-turn-helix (wHTH) protein/tetratricopeptide (TPR) repeat protein
MPVFKGLVDFGDFRLDLNNLILMRGGEPVRLPPKSIDTLVMFLQAYPDVVSREALRSALWPDVTVDESNLTQNVYVLRKMLGVGPDGRDYVETVPKRGYRFTVQPRTVTDPADETVSAQSIPSVSKPGIWSLRVWLGLTLLLLITLFFVRWFRIRPAASRSHQPEAVALYERGRVLWKQRRMQVAEAENCFRSAIRIDPAFTMAYVGLADVLATGSPPAEEAESIIRAVLRQNPDLAEAHASAGFIAMVHRWNWHDADFHFQQAIKLDPHYVWARQWRALFYSLQGRHEEALGDLQAALAAEPASVNLLTAMCATLYRAGRPREAATYCQTAAQIDPHFMPAHEGLIKVYTRLNNAEGAATEFASITPIEQAVPSSPRFDKFNAAFQRGGLPEMWRLRRQEIESTGDPYFLGEASAFLGQREEALKYLERSCDLHGFFMVFAKSEPAFAFVRNDPRFLTICRRIGLAEN